MSSLKKPYEISVWRDVFQGNKFVEQKVAIIGSDIMTSQYRAADPKLVRKINGSNEFSFTLYRRYKNSISGKEVINPFVDLINNESKIKLYYDDKWYDFIIKDIQQDSSKRTIKYSATDQHINELSKNGYNLELADDLMNNNGTLKELAATVIADTDWTIDENSDILEQYLEETLVELKQTEDDANPIYGFFSCCQEGTSRFQFITNKSDLGEPNADSVYEHPIEHYIENPILIIDESTGLAWPQPGTYAIDGGNDTFNFPTIQYATITSLRAMRKVYTHKSVYNPVLDKYVYYYTDTENNNLELCGFTETNYITSNIIENYVTNNTFKSTSGWRGATITDGEKVIESKDRIAKPKCEAIAIDESGTTLLDDIKSGAYAEKADTSIYEPCLKISGFGEDTSDQTQIITNSGFYDFRKENGNLEPNQKFVLMYRCKDGAAPQFVVEVADYNYNTGDDTYHTTDKTCYLSFDTMGAKTREVKIDEDATYTYYYVVGSVIESYNLTEREYRNSKIQIFIRPKSADDLYFYDFQIFEWCGEGESFITPLDQRVEAKTETTYYYYEPFKKINDDSGKEQAINTTDPTAAGYVSAQQDYQYYHISKEPEDRFAPVYTNEKYRSVSISKSNYYNAIQELCETFECWADFQVEHDSIGQITNKSIRFCESVGNDNWGGFRYGVNLKGTKRTMNSKTFVSKLIVPDNVSEVAENGFCSIARAKSNVSGENYILNFSYYINQGMIDGKDLYELFYRPATEKEREDKESIQGYYLRLRDYNNTITKYSDLYSALVEPLSQAEADYQTAQAGLIAAQEKLEDAETAFLLGTGYAWSAIPENQKELVSNSNELLGYLIEISEYKVAAQKYELEASRAKASLEFYQELNDAYYKNIQEATVAKTELNKNFFSQFSRFIQEGTWTDNSYLDHEKYYIDALATSYNSCQPQVSYTFDVVDLSALPEYKTLDFALGDLTWVEDPELFGKSRESVVITELSYSLDSPDKNTIKVQNYRNQFADLFQKMTATTQTVQYSSAAWERAGNFTGSSPITQAAFLQDAMESAELVLKNSGEQSVVWDKTGITVTDNDSPNKQIRIVGGAILLRDEDGDGLGWKVGITSSGINAKLITAGQLDTGVIQIMKGNDPCFRWDANGINAYWLDKTAGKYLNVDSKKAVRFDKYGLYGFSLGTEDTISAADWTPDGIEKIKEKSVFSLTWEGLSINAKTGERYATKEGEDSNLEPNEDNPYEKSSNSKTILGKTNGLIYNDWDSGKAIYDTTKSNPKFTKVMSITDAEGTEQFALYDDGTAILNKIYLGEHIGWSPAATQTIPSENQITIYCLTNALGLSVPEIIEGKLPNEWVDLRPSVSKDNRYLYSCLVDKKVENNETTYSNPTTPKLIEAYFENEAVSSISYADFTNLTNGGKEEGLFYNEKGNLCINASYINTGTLIVSDGNGEDLFYASIDSKIVKIAGFTVKSYKPSLGTGETAPVDIFYHSNSGDPASTDSFFIAPKGLYLENRCGTTGEPVSWGIVLGDKFGVTTGGILYAKGANISGNITAESGKIGDWDITTDGIVYTTTGGTETRISSTGRISTDYISATSGKITSLTTKNLIINNDLSANKIKIGSIPLSATTLTVGGQNSNIVVRTVKYNSTVSGKAITITATLDADNESKDSLYCTGEVCVIYPGITSNKEELWTEFTIEIKSGQKTGDTVIYGFYSGENAGGDLRNTLSTVSYVEVKDETSTKAVIATTGGILFQGIYDNNYFNIGSICPYASNNTGGIKAAGIWVFSGNATFNGYSTFNGDTKFVGKVLNSSGTTQFTSDRRLKTDITQFSTSHSQLFDELKPVSFSYKSNPGTHFGFIAQDVLAAFDKTGLDSSQIVSTFAGEDGNQYYGLSYTDIIALNTAEIQSLKARVAALEQKLSQLKI